MNLIKNIPIPISGLILALLSLGNLLEGINPYLKYFFGLTGIIFLILIILKVILYPKLIKNDFKNPVIVSSSGTFSMSLMVLSTYLLQFIPSIAYTIWIIGIALHIMLIIYFLWFVLPFVCHIEQPHWRNGLQNSPVVQELPCDLHRSTAGRADCGMLHQSQSPASSSDR